jgi:hypothetical protein
MPFWTGQRVKYAVGCLLSGLAACSAPHTIATFQTGDTTIALVQSTQDGGYAVSVGPHTSLPLGGYTSARVDSIWNMATTRLVAIIGADAGCKLRYTLVVAASDTASIRSIGDCGEAYSFARLGNALAIRQTDVRNPKVWTFVEGTREGLTVQIARPLAPSPRAALTHLGESASGATSLPPVSAPVGDEVIPSPVGGSRPTGNPSNEVPKF